MLGLKAWATTTWQFKIFLFEGFPLLGVFILFVFSFIVVLEASSVWHLTNFELVLSIKSIFIKQGQTGLCDVKGGDLVTETSIGLCLAGWDGKE